MSELDVVFVFGGDSFVDGVKRLVWFILGGPEVDDCVVFGGFCYECWVGDF